MEAQRHLLEEAVEEFWNGFLVERSNLRSFAITQDNRLPQGFITAYVARLNRARWTRLIDPGYEIARKIMCRLSVRFVTDQDPDEYVCSIFDLEKRVKRRQEKERKKDKRFPRWDLLTINKSIAHFLDAFPLDGTDLITFAESRVMDFPRNYVTKLTERLNRAGWIEGLEVPVKVMNRLASSFAKPIDLEDDYFRFIIDMERKLEKEEAQRRRIANQLRKEGQEEVKMVEKRKERANKAALNEAVKERKRKATMENLRNRIGVTSLGLKY